jgi:hypothetical protein
MSSSFGASFSKKSIAPSRIACTVERMLPWPVRKMMGSAFRVRARADCKASPFISGICKSTMTQPGASASR